MFCHVASYLMQKGDKSRTLCISELGIYKLNEEKTHFLYTQQCSSNHLNLSQVTRKNNLLNQKENQMFSTKFLAVLLTLWLYQSNYAFKASGDDVTQSPTSSPPPLAYGAPPPPPPYGYPSKCPPPPPARVECCTYTFAPPNPYTPVPYGEGSSIVLPVLVPLMMLISSFIFLF